MTQVNTRIMQTLGSGVQTRGVPMLRRSGRGFTLLEVIISITILGIALSLLLAGFRFTSKAWEASAGKSQEIADLQVVHRLFTGMLSRAFPVALDDEDEPAFAFDADENHVRFTTYMPPYPDRAGLYTVEFFIVRDGDNEQLRLKREPFESQTFLDGAEDKAEDVLLMEADTRIAFSYFSGQQTEEDGEWQDAWENIDQLPLMVRLSFEAANEGTLDWPDIISRIEINLDNACIFPELGGKCRESN